MELVQESTDTLTLDLIKAHILVSHNLDDVLLEHYKKASLELIEEYLSYSLLERIYKNTPSEIDGDNKQRVITLQCPYKPDYIIRYFEDGSQDEIGFQFDIGAKELYVYNETELNITKIEAFMFDRYVNAVHQIRLLMIGNWYEFRTADTNLNIKEVPTGIMFMIDKLKGSEL